MSVGLEEILMQQRMTNRLLLAVLMRGSPQKDVVASLSDLGAKPE